MPIQYQNFLGFQLIASIVRTSNLRFNFFRSVIQIAKWAFVSLSSSKGVKYYILKKICHKVSAALLSALPLYVHLTAYIIQLDSDSENTLNFFGRGRDSYSSCHSYSCRSLSRFSNVATSFQRKTCRFYWRFQMASWSYEANQLFDNLQEAVVHNFDIISIDSTFYKTKFF